MRVHPQVADMIDQLIRHPRNAPTGAQTSRIALFIPSLSGGGAERVMATLATELASRGHDIRLLLVNRSGPYLSEIGESVRIVDLGARRTLTSLPQLVRYLRTERPSALLSTLSHANIIAIWAAKLSRVPVKVVIREANVVAPKLRKHQSSIGRMMPWLAERFYKRADAAVAVSGDVAADLEKLGIPSNKITVIHNPTVTPELYSMAEQEIDHPWFAPGEPPVIIGMGRLTEQKDFSLLIRAFALVRNQCSARLMIFGEGEERGKLEGLAEGLGVTEDVEFPGFVPNPFPFLKRARVFTMSSAWEGLPNALIQALALGVPVVATRCSSGPVEILEDGRWGVLVPMGDERALAEAVISVLDAAPEGDELRERAESFAVGRIGSSYEKLLTGVSCDDGGAVGKDCEK